MEVNKRGFPLIKGMGWELVSNLGPRPTPREGTTTLVIMDLRLGM